MRKIAFLFLFTLIFITGTFPQGKLLTLEEINGRNAYRFYPEYVRIIEGLPQLQWKTTSDVYTYVKNDALWEGTTKAGSDKQVLDLPTFNKNLVKSGFTELKSFPEISWVSDVSFRFEHGNALLIYDMKKGSAAKVNSYPDDMENADIEPNTFAIAFTRDNNLYVLLNNQEPLAVTTDADKNIVNGQTVSRHEFNTENGKFWSPKGNFLAFYRKDESQVTDYPITDISKVPAVTKNIKYPMAGGKSEILSVGVFDVKNNKTIWLKTGEKNDKYLTNITWSPDEKYIYIAVLNRDQNHMILNQYDAITGELVKTLFEEKNQKYIEPESGPIFFRKKTNEFLWFSERNGYRHLFRYTTDGELIEQLTDGKFDVLEFVGFDPTEQFVLYKAVDEDFPLQQSIYSINLQTKEVVKISTADGVHEATLSPTGKFFFDSYSSAKVPSEVLLCDITGLVVKKLYTGENPLKDYTIGEITTGSLQAEDKTELYYRMIKPVNFDPAKKYPVVVYVYGGPHAQMITNSWNYGASMWMLYMAQQGFIVFTLDNRGSANRGLKFEQAIFRNIGTVEIQDQMTGIKYLKDLPYVDADRIGVHGWSYGGYMAAALILKQPETFKVSVAGAPVIDWSMYEVMYGERYMDTPADNPEGYKNANLLNFINNLKGKLLIVHGTSDDTVVLQHTLRFVQECNHNNVQVDYYLYPGHSHAVRGKDRLHLDTKITNYFIDNLKK